MKKFMAFVLALVMLLSLAACGSKPEPAEEKPAEEPVSETSTAANGGATTVADANADGDIYSWIINEDTSLSGKVRFYIPFGEKQGMADMIKEFNETYPNIEIILNTYSNNSDGNIALNTAIMAGECDVVASFEIHNLMNRVNNGLYKDITDRVKEEEINLVDNWGTEAYNVDGKTYVFSCGGLIHYVAINMDAWNEAGLGDLPTEWTWDEYIEASAP